ncbi:hypothetical protein N1851_026046 [Merluccius polli]|uniref:DDE Tnp4 domain-containing protein n=1 Tax=Merluccius polli TaxID=89951 RepID=A0AA47MCL0_MERPO|nr:hypothetical protein N1851_026046 [Merluccius polli]
MDVDDFNFLLDKVQPLIQRKDTTLRKAITARQRLSVSVLPHWKINNWPDCETCEALCMVLKDHLKTPTTEAGWREVARGFQDRCQFPHCLGAIDGKHVYIQTPANSGSLFYNYKGRFSVVLMAVVDANYKFVYASVGTQGRMSDASLFGQSDLRSAMDRGLLNVPKPEPLPNSNVIMPYIARRTVENAFGILANRLRVFLTNIALDPDKVTAITLAALSIHNFLREKGSEAYVPPAFVDTEDESHRLVFGTWRRGGALNSVALSRARNATEQPAKEQRDQLKAYFQSPAGSVYWQEDMI